MLLPAESAASGSDFGRQWALASNGSLILINADPERAGRYLCQVSNGIGQDLTQVVNFTVKGEGDKEVNLIYDRTFLSLPAVTK